VYDDNRTALLSSFNNLDPNGTWTLFLADQSGGRGEHAGELGIGYRGLGGARSDHVGVVVVWRCDGEREAGPLLVSAQGSIVRFCPQSTFFKQSARSSARLCFPVGQNFELPTRQADREAACPTRNEWSVLVGLTSRGYEGRTCQRRGSRGRPTERESDSWLAQTHNLPMPSDFR
jgi:hypothetical protein